MHPELDGRSLGIVHSLICCYDNKYTKPVQIYRGENAVYKFMEKMLQEVKYFKNIIKTKFNKPLKMTDKDEEEFKKLIIVIFVNRSILIKTLGRDCCHITHKYRGSAHQDCNLNFQLTDKIPVIFHNLQGYDSHFIMQQIGQIAKNHTYTYKKGKECQTNKE